MNRLYNLDYLRGLAAFGIMIFHYLSWTWGTSPADSILGRIGIYGVSIFYVLSGLTLYFVYHNKMKPSKAELIAFFRKRFFRIFPLLWLVIILRIMLFNQSPNLVDLFLNLTGLFGFVSWDRYLATGVWSIGNELVFYVFFPFFILFIKKVKALMVLLSLLLVGIYIYFAFIELDPGLTLSAQWKDYVNPLNQVFLFLGGFLIGYFFHSLRVKSSVSISMLFIALVLFSFYPASGDTIQLVTGPNRLVFTACCFLVCMGFYKLNFKFNDAVHKPLALLGEASYSVYLLHPIVWKATIFGSAVFSKHLFVIDPVMSLFLSVLLTLVASYFVYRYYEKYFMKLGSRYGHKQKEPQLTFVEAEGKNPQSTS